MRNAHAPALVDPPNRASFTDGAPRTLTFAQADRAISAFAATLRGLGLHTDTVVGLQLPNTVESVIAFLGVLRAGMIAAPLPLLWRQQDMVEALGRAGAKAIVTAGRIGACAHAEVAMEVAAELFPIRQICAFGETLPDGVVPLDGIFTAGRRRSAAAAHRQCRRACRGRRPSTSVRTAPSPCAHDHARLAAAGGRAPCARAAIGVDAPILSTIPLGSFAGLAATLLPWLIAGGPLHLHHGFDRARLSHAMRRARRRRRGAAGTCAGRARRPRRRRPTRSWPSGARRLGRPRTWPWRTRSMSSASSESELVAAARPSRDGLPDPAIVDAAAMSGSAGLHRRRRL